MSERMPTYGGQALIEGVMMRGAKFAAVAMRAPDQQIVIHTEQLNSLYQSRLTKIPFVRGLFTLWDALSLGMRALTMSANLQAGEGEKLEGRELALTMATSLALAVGLFFLLPALGGQLVEHALAGDIQAWLSSLFAFAQSASASSSAGATTAALDAAAAGGRTWHAWWGNLAEGLFRLGLVIGYMVLIGRIPEIARVFGYHGAEHKTINAFEAGAELTPANVQRFSLEHPRCGTAFLLTLVLLSVVIFSLLGPMPLGVRLVSRVLFIPILAGIAYEYIRWTARNLSNPVVCQLIRPNLALQRLTTREPSLEMLEVSIAAFQAMKTKEETQ